MKNKFAFAAVTVLLICLGFIYFVFLSGLPARSGVPLFKPNVAANYTTQPIDRNGDVDYIRFVDQIRAEGVTPESNIFAAVVEIFGEKFLDVDLPDQFYFQLGIARPRPPTKIYIWEDWAAVHCADLDARKQYQPASEYSSWESDVFYYAASYPWSAEELPEFAEWLKSVEPEFEQLRKSLDRPHFYCPQIPIYEEKFSFSNMYNLNAIPMRRLARCFQINSNRHLTNQNAPAAIGDLKAMFALAQAQAKDVSMVGRLTALMLRRVAIEKSWHVVRSSQLSKSELETVRTILSELESLPSFCRVINEYERFVLLDAAQKMVRYGNGEEFSENVDVNTESHGRAHMICDAEVAMVHVNSFCDRLVAEIKQAEQSGTLTNVSEIVESLNPESISFGELPEFYAARIEGRAAVGKKLGIALTSSFDNFGRMLEAEIENASRLEMLNLAIILELHRLEHGSFPEKLDQLTSLESQPIDPLNSGAFIYRVEDDGEYVLYSSGPNGIDDGGLGEDESTSSGEFDDVKLEELQTLSWADHVLEQQELQE